MSPGQLFGLDGLSDLEMAGIKKELKKEAQNPKPGPESWPVPQGAASPSTTARGAMPPAQSGGI